LSSHLFFFFNWLAAFALAFLLLRFLFFDAAFMLIILYHNRGDTSRLASFNTDHGFGNYCHFNSHM